jgi:hypothetical protein
MSLRYQASIMATKYFPLKTPNAPTIGTASIDSDTSIAVTFTAPSIVGDSAITEYRAVALDASTGQTFVATGTTSPIKITGLNNGNFYTVKVYAVNSYGSGPFSAPSNSGLTVKFYTTAGTYSFIVPAGVTTLSAAAIGGGGGAYGVGGTSAGGGGGGGAFRYVNNISVTPGATFTVTVGAAGVGGISSTNGGASSFGTNVVANGGTRSSGSSGGAGGSGGTGNGGNGGAGNSSGGNYGTGWEGGGGGGGAGGYASAGGNGGNASLSNPPYNQNNNGSYGGGSGGFGGGTNGYVGGGVGFNTLNGGTTSVWSQSNMPLSGGYAYDGEAGYYGGGGGGSAAATGYATRPPEGGAVQVKWGGLTY